ncbi:uncharacterized protein J3D65DRAFT_636547 [Phyllosticta citribraziliensis]|uniref:Uncharacterized protein n=1 Tax=Phyllosticta citribraziliensis TaxID=989973 RepID=A0ABR1LD22_9PEZI
MRPLPLSVLLLARFVAAQTVHTVTVGGLKEAAAPGGQPSPNFIYQPESITAAPGDVVQFNFLQLNHTITQSSFENPCAKAPGGFDSGFVVNEDGRPGLQFSVRVNDTNPICELHVGEEAGVVGWLADLLGCRVGAYCAQETHCGKGMVFAINAPQAGTTFNAFKASAISQGGNGALTAAGITGPTPAPAAVQPQGQQPQPAAAPQPAPSIVPGNGQCRDGSACACSCLCGSSSFPPQAAQNNFGGYAGKSVELALGILWALAARLTGMRFPSLCCWNRVRRDMC